MVSLPVLVTGATGGLGRVMVDSLLAQGRAVIASGRDPAIGAQLAASGARFIPADLAHDDLAPLCEGVGSVFHLAALSSPWGSDDAFIKANVLATTRLLKAARKSGASRFVFASTPSVYTRAAHQIGLTERSPLPPRLVNAYARTKLMAEEAVLAAAAPGFAATALRPRAVIGPHDTVLLPRLLRAAAKGVMPLPGMGKALIEPSDARDVADAFLAAEARAEAVSGRVFNVSGGQPIALKDLAAHAFARMNRNVRLVPLPARMVLALAHLAEGSAKLKPGHPEPPITAYSAMALGWSQTFDLAAAHRDLGWQPRRDPFSAIDWALEARNHA